MSEIAAEFSAARRVDGEAEEDIVEWVVSSKVSAAGMIDGPVVVTRTEDLVDSEAVLGVEGLPIVSWTTATDSSDGLRPEYFLRLETPGIDGQREPVYDVAISSGPPSELEDL